MKPGLWQTRATTTWLRTDHPSAVQQAQREAGLSSEQLAGFRAYLKETLAHRREVSSYASCVTLQRGLLGLDAGAGQPNTDDRVLISSSSEYQVQRHTVNYQFVADETLRMHLKSPTQATYADNATMNVRIADLTMVTVGTSRWVAATCVATK